MNSFNGIDGQRTLRQKLMSTKRLNNKKSQKSKLEQQSNTKDYQKLLQGFFAEKASYQEGFKDRIQKEIEKIEEKIYQNKKEAINDKKMFCNTNSDFKVTKKKKQTLTKFKQDQKKQSTKTQTILSNFFDRNTQKIVQILILKLLIDEDNNKEIRKKVEEYRQLEKTVLNHNTFLMFLLNKKINYVKDSLSSQTDVHTKFNNLMNKLDYYLSKSQVKEEIQNSKNITIENFLNQELFQNYEQIKSIQEKHNIKIPDIIYKVE